MGISTEHIVLVFDGMGGDYALVEVMQFCSEDLRWAKANIPLQRIEKPTRKQESHLYKNVYQKMGLDVEGEPDHYILTHHS